jgi:hemolysin D
MKKRLRRGDQEFLPAAIEILETPASPVRLAIIVTICALAATALLWAYVGRIDIIAVAQGKIQPVGRSKVVQPLETGKVKVIKVVNGQRVRAGDLLVELDPSESLADEAALTESLHSASAEAARRRASLDVARTRMLGQPPSIAFPPGTPPDIAEREQRVFDSDLGQLTAAVASLEAQTREKLVQRDHLKATITAERQLLATQNERVEMKSTLAKDGSGSKASLIDAQETMQTQATYLTNLEGQVADADANVEVVERDIAKTYSTFMADNAQKLADAERLAGDDERKLAKARLATAHMILTSPIDGVVQGMSITSLGQVVTTGEEVMEIVPQRDALEIESYLDNGDIGFIQKGQHAVVKIKSFPFTRYGAIDAEVTRVAEDAIPLPEAEQREENPTTSAKTALFGGAQRTQNLVYPVTLSLDRHDISVDGATVALIPGMAVTVEIKTGSRRILEYLFSPVTEVASESLRER